MWRRVFEQTPIYFMLYISLDSVPSAYEVWFNFSVSRLWGSGYRVRDYWELCGVPFFSVNSENLYKQLAIFNERQIQQCSTDNIAHIFVSCGLHISSTLVFF